MASIVDKLRGGDRRSVGRSNEVSQEISTSGEQFALVMAAMFGEDTVVCMRAADAIEKASVTRSELLQPFKRQILNRAASVEQQDVRWHLAQMLPRLRLTKAERDRAVAILLDYLQDKSSIVRTFAMQGLADFALQDRKLRAQMVPILEHLTETGSAAMRARGRKLLAALLR
jgi:hypothetical protein